LEETCRKYLKALEVLQDEKEHGATKKAVDEFLAPGGEGERAQAMLKSYAQNKDRCGNLS
jgi:carnitine O-acetyltransferase